MAAAAGEEIENTESGGSRQFIDVEDGWFDLGSFLDKAHGFVPVISPITEPAVGYGGSGLWSSWIGVHPEKVRQVCGRI